MTSIDEKPGSSEVERKGSFNLLTELNVHVTPPSVITENEFGTSMNYKDGWNNLQSCSDMFPLAYWWSEPWMAVRKDDLRLSPYISLQNQLQPKI